MVAWSESGARFKVRPESKFYLGVAAAGVLVAFGGFIPTYWAKLGSGTLHANPIIHLHGALFFTWTLYYFAQNWLVASGRVEQHRTWGLLGVSLLTAMAFTVPLAAINSMNLADQIGMGDQGRAFAIVPMSILLLILIFAVVGIVNVHRPQVHKRFMVLIMAGMLEAAIARVFLTLFAPPGAVGPPPVVVTIPAGIAAFGFVIALLVYDWRTRGKPHAATLIGGGALALRIAVIAPLSTSPAWMAIAGALQGLAGN